jgi:hypothetical protein
MSDTTKRTNRTKILAGGVRARVLRPGETDEQVQKWQESILKRSGRAAMVFPSQALFDKFLENGKRLDRYKALVERVMAQYFAGELVPKPKPKVPKSAAMAC